LVDNLAITLIWTTWCVLSADWQFGWQIQSHL